MADPLFRFVGGTAVLGAVALICAVIGIRRDNEAWATRKSLPVNFAAPASTGHSATRALQSSSAARNPSKTAPDRAAIRPLVAERALGERSPIADKLHAPEQGGIEDLRMVMNLFTHYRDQFGGYPTAEDNPTMVNALTGNNPGHMAFIDRSHRAMDAQGQLLDRWGSPLFFHLVARDAIEIRSAGPDNKFYTADDLVTASPAVGRTRLAGDPRED